MNDLSQPVGRTPGLADPTAFSGLAVKTSSIVGTRVVNRQNEDLGKVEEVVIDVFNGRIAYLVLSFGGFLGLGEKLYAVPWKALHYDNDTKVYVLNLSKDQIEHAPGFEKETWPEFTNEGWNRTVHDYYELPPFWMP
ncbi:MAG: PRC-barrel domain-containing protein [Betaproteobacteria bacterium]